MKLYKKVSKAGGITIPQQFRHSLNIPKGAAVEIEADEEKIVIRKHIPTCMVCGTASNVAVVGEVEMCRHCTEELENRLKEIEKHGAAIG